MPSSATKALFFLLPPLYLSALPLQWLHMPELPIPVTETRVKLYYFHFQTSIYTSIGLLEKEKVYGL